MSKSWLPDEVLFEMRSIRSYLKTVLAPRMDGHDPKLLEFRKRFDRLEKAWIDNGIDPYYGHQLEESEATGYDISDNTIEGQSDEYNG